MGPGGFQVRVLPLGGSELSPQMAHGRCLGWSLKIDEGENELLFWLFTGGDWFQYPLGLGLKTRRCGFDNRLVPGHAGDGLSPLLPPAGSYLFSQFVPPQCCEQRKISSHKEGSRQFGYDTHHHPAVPLCRHNVGLHGQITLGVAVDTRDGHLLATFGLLGQQVRVSERNHTPGVQQSSGVVSVDFHWDHGCRWFAVGPT
jgi:hypothetical protein